MFKRLLHNFNQFERAWLLLFSLIILIVTIMFSLSGTRWDSPESIFLNWILSPISALTGILTVVLCARGHILNAPLGFINSLTYGWIAWKSGYYGDWLLNWFYFLPTQIWIWVAWRQHLRRESRDLVIMRRLDRRQAIILGSASLLALIVFGLLLDSVDFWFVHYWRRSVTIYGNITQAFGIPLLGPLADSATEVFQIVAQILLIRRYAEQWLFWIATNIISIIMWLAVIATDPQSLAWAAPTLIMWIAFFVNSVYGAWVWYRESDRIPKEGETHA
jgi:nicotinamide mononucleotide transporter